MRRQLVRWLAIAGVPLVSAACATQITGGPLKPGDTTTPGIRYRLGRDLVKVDAVVTRTVVRPIGKGSDSTSDKPVAGALVEGTVSIVTVPDETQSFLLDLEPGGTADNTITIGLSPSGVVRSINASALDQSGAILGNTLEFAGRAAGAVMRGGAMMLDVNPPPQDATTEVVTLKQVRHLSAVAPIEAIMKRSTERGSDGGQSDANSASDLGAAWKELEAAGLRITAEPIPAGGAESVGPVAEQEPEEEPALRVYYRQSTPIVVTVWTPSGQWFDIEDKPPGGNHQGAVGMLTDDDATINAFPTEGDLAPLKQQVFNVLDPRTPPIELRFSGEAFSTQSLTMEFDENGRLVSLKQSGSSPVAGVASGLNSGSEQAAVSLVEGAGIATKLAEQEKLLLENQKSILELKQEIDALKQSKP